MVDEPESPDCDSALTSFDEDIRDHYLQPYHLIWRKGEVTPPQPVRMAEVVLVGELAPSPDGDTHCFAPRYQISHARIERVIEKYEFDSVPHAVELVFFDHPLEK